MNQNIRLAIIIVIGIIAALLTGPFNLFSNYVQFVIGTVAASSIAVLTISMLAGLSGIWSLGHTAFLAVGAYTGALLAAKGFPLEAIVPIAMILSGGIGFILGLSAGRFAVLYFGLLTLALAMASNEVIGQWTDLTGGDQGMEVAKVSVALLGRKLTLREAAPMGIILAMLVYIIGDRISTGERGHRWLAVKSQRTASMSIGLKPHIENALAFSLSAALVSVGGVATAFQIGYLDPEGFNLDGGVALIVATVVGGVGSTPGALLGAIFVVAVPELARKAPGVSTFVYGFSTIAVLLFLRRGIVPSLALLIRGRRKSVANTAHAAIDSDKIAAMVAELLPRAQKSLELTNVSVQFGGLRALDTVSLTLPPGGACGLIGPNGAGKTTMLNVISGLVKPTAESQVRLGETDLTSLPPYARARLGIGRTFQHAELFGELPIRATLVTTARLAAASRRAQGIAISDPHDVADRLITGLGLAPYADALPAEMPFGIQKVADIARTLAAGASVIFMDEPFSGLDNNERAELRAIIAGLRKAGASLLIIDHAVQEVLDIADHVLVLDFGRMLAQGLPAEIRDNPDVLRAYFGNRALSKTAEAISHG